MAAFVLDKLSEQIQLSIEDESVLNTMDKVDQFLTAMTELRPLYSDENALNMAVESKIRAFVSETISVAGQHAIILAEGAGRYREVMERAHEFLSQKKRTTVAKMVRDMFLDDAGLKSFVKPKFVAPDVVVNEMQRTFAEAAKSVHEPVAAPTEVVSVVQPVVESTVVEAVAEHQYPDYLFNYGGVDFMLPLIKDMEEAVYLPGKLCAYVNEEDTFHSTELVLYDGAHLWNSRLGTVHNAGCRNQPCTFKGCKFAHSSDANASEIIEKSTAPTMNQYTTDYIPNDLNEDATVARLNKTPKVMRATWHASVIGIKLGMMLADHLGANLN